ncbi:MAG: hypothetical protein ACJA2M_000873 [Polaribacter sp.]|jgi:hypothetical protein
MVPLFFIDIKKKYLFYQNNNSVSKLNILQKTLILKKSDFINNKLISFLRLDSTLK